MHKMIQNHRSRVKQIENLNDRLQATRILPILLNLQAPSIIWQTDASEGTKTDVNDLFLQSWSG